MTLLPGLNYDSKLDTDDLIYAANSTENEILNRIKILMGYGIVNPTSYGILDTADPALISESDVTRPLAVYASSSNPLKVNVYPGWAVCASGALVSLNGLLEEFELARTNLNDILVLFLENEIIDSDPTRVTRYNVSQKTRRTQVPNNVKSVLLSDYTNSSLFPSSRRENTVVLTVATVVEGSAGYELNIDYTNTTYTYNRPWFSPQDYYHREKIGSGSVTDNNPHGISYNDLTSGNLSLYEQILAIGAVQSRDDDVKGAPGTICQESIIPARVLIDSGATTLQSRFGKAGAKYILLSQYPTAVVSFYPDSHPGNSIAFDWIPGTRIVVIPDPQTLTENATIEYTTTQAGLLPSAILSNKLTFGQPADNELIYSGGVALSEISGPTIDFDGSGPVPRDYTVYARENGTLITTPNRVVGPILLDDLGTVLYPVDVTLYDFSRISVGLADANTVTSMTITLRVYGKDINQNSITEDFLFDGNTWAANPPPNTENPSQFIISESVFSSITDVQVINRTNDGPASKIIVWAQLTTGTSTKINKLAKLAKVVWDGLAIDETYDLRNIMATVPEYTNRYASMELLGRGGTNNIFNRAVDFKYPQFLDNPYGEFDATNSSFYIIVNDYTQYAGVTISLPVQPGDPAKTLTPVLAAPNRAAGQFLAVGSNNSTRDDMVATINDSSFDSGITAVASVSNTSRIDCTMDISGARGNRAMSISPAIQGFVSLSGSYASGGVDYYKYTNIPRHQDYIDTSLPGLSAYDVIVTSGRFLSQAIPVGGYDATGATIEIHRVIVYANGTRPPHDDVQVRFRVATGSNAEWQEWLVMTSDGAIFDTGFYADKITKVQFIILGYCHGFTVIESKV